MESVAILRGPPLPQDMGPVMFFACLFEGLLADPGILGPGMGVDQFPQPKLGLAHLAADIVLNRIHLILGLFRRPGVAAEASILQHIAGAALPVESIFLSFLLDFRHMAVFTFQARPLMLASPESFHLRVLDLGQTRPGDGMLEVLEAHALIPLLQVEDVYPGVVIGETAVSPYS